VFHSSALEMALIFTQSTHNSDILNWGNPTPFAGMWRPVLSVAL